MNLELDLVRACPSTRIGIGGKREVNLDQGHCNAHPSHTHLPPRGWYSSYCIHGAIANLVRAWDSWNRVLRLTRLPTFPLGRPIQLIDKDILLELSTLSNQRPTNSEVATTFHISPALWTCAVPFDLPRTLLQAAAANGVSQFLLLSG